MAASNSVKACVFSVLAGLPMLVGCPAPVVTVSPGDTTIEQGETVRVEVKVLKGVLPAGWAILSRPEGSAEPWARHTPQAHDGTYTHEFRGLRHSRQYKLDLKVENAGPYCIHVRPPEPSSDENWRKGKELGSQYRLEKMRSWRLVIEFSKIARAGRDRFLQGFIAAYAESGEEEKGRHYAEILKEALTAGYFEQGQDQGVAHAKQEITDARVQGLIRQSLGVSRARGLGWKAGYINGYKEGLQQQKDNRDTPEEQLYRRGEVMYEALRAALGLI